MGRVASTSKRAASRDARDLLFPSARAGEGSDAPATSTSAAVTRRAARATDSGRRSERSGSVALHTTSAQRMRSIVAVSGQVPSDGADQSPRTGDCHNHSATSSNAEVAASSVAARPR